MNKKYELSDNCSIFFKTPNDGYSYFFGYYDKPSLNKNNTKLLTHRVRFDGREVRDGDIAEIGYFNIGDKKFVKIDETLAWNWQQGSQLQWLSPEYDNRIIYNNIKNNKFISIIYDIKTKKKKIIPFPIYAIHPNGKNALGINYERHYWCRPGYNYQNIKNEKWNKPYSKKDGIYKINLQNGKIKLLISIVDIINIDKLKEFKYCNNWLEHIIYNPNGNKFMFFHRWRKNNTDYTRLYTVNSNGNKIISYPDVKFYSHAYWKNNNTLTIWSHDFNILHNKTIQTINNIKNNTFIKIFVKPIYKTSKMILSKRITENIQIKGRLYNLKNSNEFPDTVGKNILDKIASYGHISWYNNKKHLLTDTYQNQNGYRQIYILNTVTNKFKNIAKFYSIYNDTIYRCDLHPRLSLDEQFIVIDSAYQKKRKQIILKINI